MKRWLIVGILSGVMALLMACAAPTEAPKAEPKKLLLGCCATASSHFIYYAAVAKVINSKVPEVSVTYMETGAAVENIKRMGKGEMDFGQTTEDQRYLAIKGLDVWKDSPVPELRLLWHYQDIPCPPIVREDSGIKKLEELDGKAFHPGMRGSATETNTKRYFEVLGIKPKWWVGGLDDAVAATKDRRIVGFTKCLAAPNAPDASMLDMAVTAPVRILPVPVEQQKNIREKLPWLSFSNVEAGVYKADWNKDPVPSLSLLVGPSTTTRLPADLAYKITRAAVEDNRPGGEGIQAAAFPGVKGTDFAKLTVETADNLIHAGALKYYKELGLKIKDSQIPPEAK